MAKHYKRMTASNFAQIKALISAGVKTGQIQKAMGRSYNVINLVKRSKDFKDDSILQGEKYSKYRKVKKWVKMLDKKNGEPKMQSQITVSDTSTSDLLQSILTEMKDLNKKLSEKKIIW